jgi:hypothetical protein
MVLVLTPVHTSNLYRIFVRHLFVQSSNVFEKYNNFAQKYQKKIQKNKSELLFNNQWKSLSEISNDAL